MRTWLSGLSSGAKIALVSGVTLAIFAAVTVAVSGDAKKSPSPSATAGAPTSIPPDMRITRQQLIDAQPQESDFDGRVTAGEATTDHEEPTVAIVMKQGDDLCIPLVGDRPGAEPVSRITNRTFRAGKGHLMGDAKDRAVATVELRARSAQ